MYLPISKEMSLHVVIDEVSKPKGVVVITHGFAEHTGRYDYVTSYLNNSGYTVVRYDVRGHGKTMSPKGDVDIFTSFIDDAHRVVSYTKTSYPNLPVFMLGHSMGGLITAMYEVTYPNTVNGQVLTGPAVGYLKQAQGLLGKSLKGLGGLFPDFYLKNPVEDDVCSDPEVVKAYKKDPMVLRKASLRFYREFTIEAPKYLLGKLEDYKTPVFIAHGEKDTVVLPMVSESFYNTILSEDKSRKIYPELFHEILNETCKDDILSDIVAWLDTHIDE